MQPYSKNEFLLADQQQKGARIPESVHTFVGVIENRYKYIYAFVVIWPGFVGHTCWRRRTRNTHIKHLAYHNIDVHLGNNCSTFRFRSNAAAAGAAAAVPQQAGRSRVSVSDRACGEFSAHIIVVCFDELLPPPHRKSLVIGHLLCAFGHHHQCAIAIQCERIIAALQPHTKLHALRHRCASCTASSAILPLRMCVCV